MQHSENEYNVWLAMPYGRLAGKTITELPTETVHALWCAHNGLPNRIREFPGLWETLFDEKNSRTETKKMRRAAHREATKRNERTRIWTKHTQSYGYNNVRGPYPEQHPIPKSATITPGEECPF
jgi:hypothetical protein